MINRDRAAELGRETVDILKAGVYKAPSGATVQIRTLLDQAVQQTQSYPPDSPLLDSEPGSYQTRLEVINETTLAAARRLVGQGLRVAALNFASATHPGGGFLSGARAQEESLARSSGLYACLVNQPMYAFHQARRDAMYTDYVIYSPAVPVFRTDDGALLETPYPCSFITSPAVNARVVLERDPSRRSEIEAAMKGRIERVLTVAALHPHDALILGAWGCGAFGNDSRQITDLFHQALIGKFRGIFPKVIFAITDWSPEQKFIGPFQEVFGGIAQK